MLDLRIILSLVLLSVLPYSVRADEKRGEETTKLVLPDVTDELEGALPLLTPEERSQWKILSAKLKSKNNEVADFLKNQYHGIDIELEKTYAGMAKALSEHFAKDELTTKIKAQEEIVTDPTRSLEDKYKAVSQILVDISNHTQKQSLEPNTTDEKEAELEQTRNILIRMVEVLNNKGQEAQEKKAQVLRWGYQAHLDKSKDSDAPLYNKLNTSARVLEHLAATLKTMQWTDEFSQFEGRLNDNKIKVLALEQTLDKALAGVYLQAKLQRLLSSDILCKSIEECKKKPEERRGQSVAPLFNDWKGKPHGSQPKSDSENHLNPGN